MNAAKKGWAALTIAGMLAACSDLPTAVDDAAPQFGHVAASTTSPPLYALGSPTKSGRAVMQLYTIDPPSGAATLVGSTGEVGLRGLGADPTTGDLYSSYGTPINTSNAGIVRIDASTGAVTRIGGSMRFVSLTFDSWGQLYGVRNPIDAGAWILGEGLVPGGVAKIYKIDVTTGSAEHVAEVTIFDNTGWQIAFNSADVLHFKDWNYRFWRVDLASGTGIFLGQTGAQPFYATLSWDFDSRDHLYFAGHPVINDEWATLDMATLTVTQIGNTGIRIRGLSFLDDNNPNTMDDCKARKRTKAKREQARQGRRGGWERYGFRNQGQCVAFIETGEDRR